MKIRILVLLCILGLDIIVCFDCPHDGLFADPNDTHYYYNCGSGKAYRVKCNAGLVFNTDIEECDYTIASSSPNSTTPIVEPTNRTDASTVAVTSQATTNAVTVPVTTVPPVVTTEQQQVTTFPPEVTTIPQTTQRVDTTPPPTVAVTTNNPTTSGVTTANPTTVEITVAPTQTTTIKQEEPSTTVSVEPPTTIRATTSAPVSPTVNTVVSVTPNPFWEETKAKIEAELAHLKTYMISVLHDAQFLIKELKVESMSLMAESIKSEITKIESFESIIAGELKKVTKFSDKFFLENSAQTLQLDKQELTTLLNDLNNALASTALPGLDPHGNP